MVTIQEKIAYLRGVIDGDSSLKESRVRFLFEKVLQILDELAHDVDAVIQAQEELEDYLEEVDFDLAFLEDQYFYEDEDAGDEEWDFDEETDSLVEVECPDCQDIVTFDEDFLFDEGVQIRCPRCDAVVFETDDFEDLDDLFQEDDISQEDGE